MNEILLSIGKKPYGMLSVLIMLLSVVLSFDPLAKYESNVKSALEKSRGQSHI